MSRTVTESHTGQIYSPLGRRHTVLPCNAETLAAETKAEAQTLRCAFPSTNDVPQLHTDDERVSATLLGVAKMEHVLMAKRHA